MLVPQPINHSIAAALLRRFPSARLVEVSEGGCRYVCAESVTVGALVAELDGAPPAERVEMVPKVAISMFGHIGQPELAAQVPVDGQLVVMTRIGSYYGLGFEEGPPAAVRVQIETNRLVGKISALPYEREPAKLSCLESRAAARGEGKGAAREALSHKVEV